MALGVMTAIGDLVARWRWLERAALYRAPVAYPERSMGVAFRELSDDN